MDATPLGVREPAPDLDAVIERGRAFRVVGDAGHDGADKEEMGRAGRSTCSAKAVMTPAMSFRGSHRDTWTTSGTFAGGGGPVWSTSTWRLMRPIEPSSRVNAAAGPGGSPASSPT